MPPPVTEEELQHAVFTLNSSSACGTDGIGIDLIQYSYKILNATLSSLYNKCISLRYYPTKWKVAKVTVLKKPNKDSYKNFKSFRPISVLNSLAKILEKILYGRLSWLSEKYNWFGKNHHGSRPGLSTETAMHELTNTVEGNFNKKIFTTVAFLDVSGAFDYTWPIAVLAALSKKKCPLYLLQIIESLFYNRTAILETESSSYTCKVL